MWDISQVNLSKLIITDEEKRILYSENEELFNEYCKNNKLNYSYGNFNNNYLNSGSNLYIKDINIDMNSIDLVCNLYAENYPKSKNINVNLKQLNLIQGWKTIFHKM